MAATSTGPALFFASTAAVLTFVQLGRRKGKKTLSTLNFHEDTTPTITHDQLTFYKAWTNNTSTDERIISHIISSWKAVKAQFHTYRCIQTLSYLSPRAKELPIYARILEANADEKKRSGNKKGILVADVGCCFGQDSRQLILDGVPAQSIHCVDLHDGYWKAALSFFHDDGTSKTPSKLVGVKTHFHDMTLRERDPASIEVSSPEVVEAFDFVLLQAVLHTISQEQQLRLLSRVHRMLKKGSGLLIGTCAGMEPAGEWELTPDGSNRRFLNSPATLTETLTRLGFAHVKTNLRSMASLGSLGSGWSPSDDGRTRIFIEFSAQAGATNVAQEAKAI